MATVRKGSGTTTRRRTRNAAKEGAAAIQKSNALDHTRAANGGSNGEVNIESIRVRAYEFFLARGGAHGDDLADWLSAEKELLGARKE
ncbi:MAG TPA: DUF2934 domain-containing protein [Candidatus Binataceae bacterium]|nr:DUF2934 domain-containing protein [Candidatus Binataceae bacterium]